MNLDASGFITDFVSEAVTVKGPLNLNSVVQMKRNLGIHFHSQCAVRLFSSPSEPRLHFV